MNKIVAKLTPNGILLSLEFIQQEGNQKLSTQDLIDFVDTDIPLIYDGKEMTVNDYLGESRCFTARVASHGYNPF